MNDDRRGRKDTVLIPNCPWETLACRIQYKKTSDYCQKMPVQQQRTQRANIETQWNIKESTITPKQFPGACKKLRIDRGAMQEVLKHWG